MTQYAKSRAGLLVRIFKEAGIRHIVLSPGSRNAPLIQAFTNDAYFSCITIFDERSAGYFALGSAQAERNPAVLICTSGTAAVNYFPAVAEASYLQVPLIVVTADRPAYLENTLDGQTIRQQNLFGDHVRFTGLLSEDESRLALRFDAKQIADAVQLSKSPCSGPVQINVPFTESLYRLSDIALPERVFYENHPPAGNSQSALRSAVSAWKRASRKLVVIGQKPPSPEIDRALNRLTDFDPGCVVVADLLSNLHVDKAVTCIDGVLSAPELNDTQTVIPDLLVYAGRSIISKKLKAILRNAIPADNIYIGTEPSPPDVFFSLSSRICAEPAEFLPLFAAALIDAAEPSFNPEVNNADYSQAFQKAGVQLQSATDKVMQAEIFGEMQAVGLVMKNLPTNATIHLGNSLPVRLAQYFASKEDQRFYGNRGTGGIDGCVSTAVGFAYTELAAGNDAPQVLICGDLTFMYDRNGLTAKPLPGNLLIIVINNNGGGIFRVIDGASGLPKNIREPYFAAADTHSDHAVADSAAVHKLGYRNVSTREELITALQHHFSQNETRAEIIEIFPSQPANTETFRIFEGTR